jgi:general secretion pathway protein G
MQGSGCGSDREGHRATRRDGAAPAVRLAPPEGDGAGRRSRGFTLVELMVVIVILGLMATVAAVNLLPHITKSKREMARFSMTEIAKAIDLFYLDQGRLPASLQELDSRPGNAKEWPEGGYLKKGVPKDPWGNDYLYRMPGASRKFDLICAGADGVEGGEGDNADIRLFEETSK